MMEGDDVQDYAKRFLSLAVEFSTFANQKNLNELTTNRDNYQKPPPTRQEDYTNEYFIEKDVVDFLKFKNIVHGGAVSINNEENEIVHKPKFIYDDGSFRVFRKSGLLQYRFMYNGKQAQVYGSTKEECWEKRFYYKPAPERLQEQIAELSEDTLYKLWAVKFWLPSKKKNGKETEYYDTIKAYLKNDILPVWGNVKLKDFRPIQISAYLNGIPKPNKREKIGAILSESLRSAMVNQLINRNPYEGVKFDHYTPPPKGAFTHRQQLLLWESIEDKKLKAFTYLLLVTGLRQGEGLALQKEDFNFSRMEINITHSIEKKTGEMKSPKSKAGFRRVPFEQELIDVIGPYMPETGRIFEYRNDYVHRFYSKQCKKLGFSGTGHILRHSFITNAYELEIPPYVVQRWAGHSKQEQADAYLDLRNSRDFIETPFVAYMRKLKARVTVV